MDVLFFGVPTWVILVSLVIVYCLYSSRNYDHWKKLGVPGPSPIPFIGTINIDTLFGRQCLSKIQTESSTRYGRIRGGYMGDEPILEVNDEEFIKEMCVKQFSNFRNRRLGLDDYPVRSSVLNAKDEEWKRIRSILAPAFSPGRVKEMNQKIIRCTNLLSEHLKETDGEVDVKEYMGAFSMDVIAAVAFGLDIDSQADRNNIFVKHAKQCFSFKLSNPSILPFVIFPSLGKYLNKLGLIRLFPKTAIDFFTSIVNQAIESRTSGEQTKLDFLQLMIDARSKNTNTKYKPVEKGTINPELTHEEIVGNGMVFLLAGYDTLATCLTFTTYALAVHEEIQETLRQEIDCVSEGQDLSNPELYDRMPYLNKVINESLRMYPPLTSQQRVASCDSVVKGIPVKKGTLIFMPTFPLHRDEESWPQPDTFDPERFSLDEQTKRIPYTYSPFGQGPRNCIGMKLALTEIKMVITKLIKNFRIMKGPNTMDPRDMVFESNLKVDLLRSTKPIVVKFVDRLTGLN